MQNLAHLRCFNHAQREAVARCPECKQFYCRECITEHEDRVLCTACLRKVAQIPVTKRPAFVLFKRAVLCMTGVTIAWFVFFLVGEALVRLPSNFHEGTLWAVPWMDRE